MTTQNPIIRISCAAVDHALTDATFDLDTDAVSYEDGVITVANKEGAAFGSISIRRLLSQLAELEITDEESNPVYLDDMAGSKVLAMSAQVHADFGDGTVVFAGGGQRPVFGLSRSGAAAPPDAALQSLSQGEHTGQLLVWPGLIVVFKSDAPVQTDTTAVGFSLDISTSIVTRDAAPSTAIESTSPQS